MKQYLLNEDSLPSKLHVRLSYDIVNDIEAIEFNNQYNTEALSEWFKSLSAVINNISNPVIAWDYSGCNKHNSNGETYLNLFGYNIGYSIMFEDENTPPYIYIFYIDLKVNDFGLEESSLYESKCYRSKNNITESKLRRIITESIRKVLYN